jgi:hypothetical protein
VRNRKAEPRVGDHVLGVPSIEAVGGEARAIAQVRLPPLAVIATAARPAEPGHANLLAHLGLVDARADGHDLADHLVAGDQRQLRFTELSIHDVQIRPTQPARMHLHQDLADSRPGLGNERRAKRLPRPVKNHDPHLRDGS